MTVACVPINNETPHSTPKDQVGSHVIQLQNSYLSLTAARPVTGCAFFSRLDSFQIMHDQSMIVSLVTDK